MSFISELLPLCRQTIVWQSMTSREVTGKPIYGGSPQTFRGRRVISTVRIASGPGEGVIFLPQWTIWILATPLIELDDLVYVLGDTLTPPPIRSVERKPDETGLDIYVKVLMAAFK